MTHIGKESTFQTIHQDVYKRQDLGILLDPISVMMLIVISTVSLMVHIYSFGYMKGEVGFQRYYAFLSLFTMSMPVSYTHLSGSISIQIRQSGCIAS